MNNSYLNLAGRPSVLLSLRLYRGVWLTAKIQLGRVFGALDRRDIGHGFSKGPMLLNMRCHNSICLVFELNHGFSAVGTASFTGRGGVLHSDGGTRC